MSSFGDSRLLTSHHLLIISLYTFNLLIVALTYVHSETELLKKFLPHLMALRSYTHYMMRL